MFLFLLHHPVEPVIISWRQMIPYCFCSKWRMPVSRTLFLLCGGCIFFVDGIKPFHRLNPVILKTFLFVWGRGIVCRKPLNKSFYYSLLSALIPRSWGGTKFYLAFQLSSWLSRKWKDFWGRVQTWQKRVVWLTTNVSSRQEGDEVGHDARHLTTPAWKLLSVPSWFQLSVLIILLSIKGSIFTLIYSSVFCVPADLKMNESTCLSGASIIQREVLLSRLKKF